MNTHINCSLKFILTFVHFCISLLYLTIKRVSEQEAKLFLFSKSLIVGNPEKCQAQAYVFPYFLVF